MTNKIKPGQGNTIKFMFFFIAFFVSMHIYAADPPPPSVILSSYTISGNLLTDKVITINMVLTNTNQNLDANNIVISYTSINNTFLPVYGISNQFFIPVIQAGRSVNYDLKVSVNNSLPNDILFFDFNATYSDAINGLSSNNFFISDSVPSENAIQLLGIDATNINVLSKDEIIISFLATVINHSNLPVQNAIMVLEGKSPDFIISIPLNDIDPGEFYTSEFHLTFPSITIPKFYVRFHYKDFKEASYSSAPQPFNVYLNNLLSNSDLQNIRDQEQSIFRKIGLVSSFLLLAIWTVVFFIRLRKKKGL